MNISREDHNQLEATLKIEFTPEDYNDKVSTKLKEYQKKANIPGFRPGKVPFGMINKMYGKAVLADEVNKLVSDTLSNYIRENELETLGTPVPNDELTPMIDWENLGNIEFYFDLGFAPKFDPELTENIAVDFYKITAENEQVEKEIEMIRRSYGKFEPVEVAEDGDWLNVEITELDATGAPVEGGITNKRKVSTVTFDNDDFKKKLVGAKKDQVFAINPHEIVKDATRVGYLLNVDADKAAEVGTTFEMKILEIERMTLADLNQEVFDKIFPGQGVEDEDTFRAKIRKDIEISYSQESNASFYNKVKETMLKELNLELPETFLKKWLKEREDERDHHHHDHDHDHHHDHDHDHDHHHDHDAPKEEPDYPKIFESMKWRLIEDRLIRKYDIKVDESEVKEYVKERYRNYFRSQGAMPADSADVEPTLDMLATKYMEKKDETEQIYDLLYADRLIDLFKSKVKIVEKEISHDEYHKLEGTHHH